MVKHQRRSHQRGIHSSELDDCTSESGSDEAPPTPKSSAMHWPVAQPAGLSMHGIAPQHHSHPPNAMHRAASFADFGHGVNYGMQQQHLLSHGPHDYSHTVHDPAAAAALVTATSMPPHHPGMPMLHRAASLPQHSYYVTDHNNPGVATMNTNAPMAAGPYHQHHHIPRQSVERMAVDIPYTGTPSLAASIQSSPDAFSASGRSPSTQDGFYTHQAPQAATYALHTASPLLEQHQHHASMVHYATAPASQQPTVVAQHHQHQQHHQQHQVPTSQPHSGDEHWYSSMPYQSPVAVAVPQMAQLAPYGSTVYDPWADAKIELETAGMQMPSARIEQM